MLGARVTAAFRYIRLELLYYASFAVGGCELEGTGELTWLLGGDFVNHESWVCVAASIRATRNVSSCWSLFLLN